MRSHIWHLFKKDGLELLRDRRTMFVNIVLPVLLFPLIMLFMIQITQLTRAQPVDAAPILVVGADDLRALMPTIAERDAAQEDAAPQPFAPAEPMVAIAEIDAVAAQILAERARALATLEDETDDHDLEAGRRLGEARAALLRDLRAEKLAALIVVDEGRPRRVAILGDDAHPEWSTADSAIRRGVERWRKRLIDARLKVAGLDADTVTPIEIDRVALAPRAESVRASLAGVIPLLLVIMAASGAFFSALDLIVGERERGTLESLLSWPVKRRDIFLGKLAVSCTAAAVSVVLNLLSLGLTTALFGSQLTPPGVEPSGLLAVGFGTLLLCFLALLPLVVTLATVSLALAGYAASSKEAQNYLTPLMLVVMVAAGVAAFPGTRPSLPLDLVPITGPMLALKEALRAADVPWLHLALSTATSLALAVVIVGWAVRLLESEKFCYPGLVRAGWGRFRRWGPPAEAPGPIEAIGLYAVVVGAFTLGGAALQRAGMPAFTIVTVPLIACLALPVLIHAWLGAYPARSALHCLMPRRAHLQRALVCVPLGVATSIGLGTVQAPFIPEFFMEQGKEMERVFADLDSLWVQLIAIALVPGICEELLCRGPILSSLRRSIGGWGGAVLAAFLFAVLHMSPYRFLPQFALGIILGLITLRSGSIVPAMLIHAGHNALVVVLGRVPIAEPPWLAGLAMGVFGWLAMLAVVALPEPRRPRPAAIAPPGAGVTPGTP